MSAHESWEDEHDAAEDLSRQTRQINLNEQRGTFQPRAPQFTPGAQSFQPGGMPRYDPYYNQSEHGGAFPQYGQQAYREYNEYPAQNFPGGYGQQRQQQPQYEAYNQHQLQSQQQQPQTQYYRSPPQTNQPAQNPKRQIINDDGAPPTSVISSTAKLPDAKPLGAKVLSIGTVAAKPKLDVTGPAKVLSIGVEAAQSTASKSAKQASIDSRDIETPSVDINAGNGESNRSHAGNTPLPPSSGGDHIQTATEARAAAREADLVAKEQAVDVDEETLQEMYGKEHVNVIFLGHVDAGKSTLGGSILYACGMVDERTMDKLRREAKEAGTESWYLSWALDLTKEERSKGKTVEVGRGFFETERRKYSILDAPGHKTFVPSMIGGASQADVGVLVISARKGEYETGFERGGQTREHAILAKTQGVNYLIVVVNKMDDPTVLWSKERYDECVKKLTNFLKGVGYNPKTDLTFMPVSGQHTINIRERVPKEVCPWYDGPSLLDYLDGMQTLERKIKAPFMMPISAKYRDLGTMVEGKIESGIVKKGVTYLLMPNRVPAPIAALYGETEDEIEAATCGEQVRIRLRGIEEEDIMPGFVLCSATRPVHCVPAFEAQIVLLDIKSILSAGFNCVMHVHSATEEVTFDALLHKLEKGTNRKSKKAPGFATKGMSIIARLRITGLSSNVCVEKFEDYPQLGRFTLRDQGQTIAIGKITRLIADPEAESGAAK